MEIRAESALYCKPLNLHMENKDIHRCYKPNFGHWDKQVYTSENYWF